MTAKGYVFSGARLCQGEINNPSTANEAWRNNFLKDENGIDGSKTELVWRILPRFTTIEILRAYFETYSILLNIDIKMIRASNSSCSHCMFFINF